MPFCKVTSEINYSFKLKICLRNTVIRIDINKLLAKKVKKINGVIYVLRFSTDNYTRILFSLQETQSLKFDKLNKIKIVNKVKPSNEIKFC